MANSLVSPGVQVTVIDESNYAPTAVGTVPFIIMATAQNKTNASGTIASGTTKANAGKVFNVTDQRSLVNQFGLPNFPFTASGSRDFGSELAEYGLYAAHHSLGVISNAYVMRADIDLAQLEGKSARPFADAAGGTLWLDTSITSWGIFEWDAYNQKFVQKIPSFLYTEDHITGGIPKSSFGKIGDYAVVGYENSANPVYLKAYDNAWYLVGSNDWKKMVPTVVAGNIINVGTNPIPVGSTIKINNVTITTSGGGAQSLVEDIMLPSPKVPGVTAAVVNNKFCLFAYISNDGSTGAASNGSVVDGKIKLESISGTLFTTLGIDISHPFACPALQFSKHSNVPLWKSQNTTPRPSGSVWIKTTNYNYGANLSTYRRNSVSNSWNLIPSLLFASDQDANYNLDPTNGGLGIGLDSLYTQYDVLGNNTATYKVFVRYASGATTVTSSLANPTLTANDTFTISVSQIGTSNLTTAHTVSVGSGTVSIVAANINALNLPNIIASVTTAGCLQLSHTKGGTIVLKNTQGTPLAALGLTNDIVNIRSGNNNDLIVSNWVTPYNPVLIEQPTEPTAKPLNGEIWFYSGVLEADILINDNNVWKGYRNVASDARGFDLTATDSLGPIFSVSKPTVNNAGTALHYGDLWIDTSAFDNYPMIWRWERSDGVDQWVEIDTTDATTENGIVFADARWDGDYNQIGSTPTGGNTDVFLDDLVPISTLLHSDWIDLDAPNAELYPNGCLLFNTRRSSNNVKKYIQNYFTVEDFPQKSLPSTKATWQTYSGKKYNNVPFFGRQAVRNVVVSAMKEAVDMSTELREEGRPFTLLLAPGYTELLGNLKQLNDDRKNTAFVIGEVPMGLSTDATVVENYLIDAVGSGTNGEDGLTANDAYTAVFYPGAATMNALDGVGSVVVPMSALILRTILLSDQRSEIWFAPAGNQRGVVDAIAIGYIDRSNYNAFVRTGTPQGLRDLLYAKRVNPVTYFPQIGYLNYGNHTRQSEATALDRINVARLVAYLRNQLEIIVRPLVFEPNDKITRDKAKAICDSLLRDIVARRGVYDFLVVCDRTNNTNDTIDRNELHIDIAIEPVKAVEFIYIPVRIKATGQLRAGNLAPATPVA
jgi:Phage tail sheath C-terminal domain